HIIKGNDEVMISPEALYPDSVRWRCIFYGDVISESSIPNHCILGTSIFFRILKHKNMLIMIGLKFINIKQSSVCRL
ncbi:type IV pili fiber building block protein, partial [Francisella tularensis subsp. holarctica]|nr:type IV pili fiber building block protein [Francisella tularensis subsp. holarctica]